MTTSVSNNNIIRLNEHYTGVPEQPDSVSLFYKRADGHIEIANEEIANAFGRSPLSGMASALPRIDKAVRQILQGNDLLNAVKNLTRAFIQLVPFLGNITLYAFDYVRTNLYFHSKIRAALAEQNGPVMGIAFDGKIVGQFSKTQFETAVKGCPENHLTVYNYLWLKLLTDAHDKSPPPTRLQVATSLVQKIKGNRL